MTIVEFLLARIAEDEKCAEMCREMFPSPWEVADRGWRVRIYASDVPDIGDHAEPGWVRQPVVMEVEPDRNIDDPLWLSERVEHVRRHDPARVLAECQAKRAIVDRYRARVEKLDEQGRPAHRFDAVLSMLVKDDRYVLAHLAAVYADHPDYDEEWKP